MYFPPLCGLLYFYHSISLLRILSLPSFFSFKVYIFFFTHIITFLEDFFHLTVLMHILIHFLTRRAFKMIDCKVLLRLLTSSHSVFQHNRGTKTSLIFPILGSNIKYCEAIYHPNSGESQSPHDHQIEHGSRCSCPPFKYLPTESLKKPQRFRH